MFFSVKRPDDLSLCLDGCGSGVRTVRLHVRTRAACRMLMWQHASGRVSEPSGWGPHRLYAVDPTLAIASFHFLSRFPCIFCLFVSFSRGLVHNLGLFCPLVDFSLHSRYFFSSLYSFQYFDNC
jgi:hypothetical protein